MYSMDMRKLYKLTNADWNHDVIPEIMDGHNIADFVDADIDEKLRALELEEDELAADWESKVSQFKAQAAALIKVHKLFHIPGSGAEQILSLAI